LSAKTYAESKRVRLYFDEFDFVASYLPRDSMKAIDPEDIRVGSVVTATYKDTGLVFKGFGGMTIFYCRKAAQEDADGRRYITCS